MSSVQSESNLPTEQQQQQQQPTSQEGGGGRSAEPKEEEIVKMAERDFWRCPDPGCKRSNPKKEENCSQCNLPRQSATQFKRDGGRGRGGGGGGRGPGGGGWQKRNDNKKWLGNKRHNYRKVLEGVDMNSSVIKMFQNHASELDDKHDRYERIVKLSRDITVESKRIIFLLHRITCTDDKPTILGEAENKLDFIRHRLWKNLAYELKGRDPYQYLRAYTGGLQEYVEAVSFYYYICHGRLIEWNEIQKDLEFVVTKKHRKTFSKENIEGKNEVGGGDDAKVGNEEFEQEGPNAAMPNKPKEDEEEKDEKKNKDENSKFSENQEILTGDKKTEPQKIPVKEKPKNDDENNEKRREEENIDTKEMDEENSEILVVNVPQTDFILGLADLTGEVMRQAINMVSTGDTDVCFELLRFLNDLHLAFLEAGKLGCVTREMVKKTHVIRQSLTKVENACYNLNVKGSQVPKHLLASYFQANEEVPHNNEQHQSNHFADDDD